MTKSSIFFLLLIMGTSSVLAGESSTYDFSWLDPDKEVYVLQNRKFRKKRSVFLSAGFGKSISGAFVDSTQFQARGSFFFLEEYGVGALYSKNRGKTSETYKRLLSDSSSFPVRRTTNEYQGAMFLFSPFYSKGNFFNKIFYYDFIIGLGLAKLNETNNRNKANGECDSCKDITEDHNGLLFDLETKFFISEKWNMSLNTNGVYYKAKNKDGTKDLWFNQWDLTVSFGLAL